MDASSILLLLLVLACPLAMAWMMRGGHGHGYGHRASHDHGTDGHKSGEPSLTGLYRMRAKIDRLIGEREDSTREREPTAGPS